MKILGADITEHCFAECLEIAKQFLSGDKLRMIFTPNPEIIYCSLKNTELQYALDSADLLLPDGVGVVLAGRIIAGKSSPINERVAGYDFLLELFKMCREYGKSVFLLGAKPEVVETAARELSNLKIVGYQDGYFQDEMAVLEKINAAKPDLLVVALGSPKQEIFINKHKNELNAKLAIGVGGALDVIAGNVKRAPEIWQKMQLEWLYRALKEPKRFKRLLVIPKFLVEVIKSR